MIQSTNITRLADSSIAADATCQGTTGAGGKSIQEMTDRPCYVYVGAFQDIGKAYFLNGGRDG